MGKEELKINISIYEEKPVKGLDPEYLRYAAWAALRVTDGPVRRLRSVHLRELLGAEQTLATRVLSQPAEYPSAAVVDAILLYRMQQPDLAPRMRAVVASVWFYRQIRNRDPLAVDLAEEVLKNPQLLSA